MGLYINHRNHEDIFKNNEEINEPNQGLFIRNHVSEMMKEQQKVNDSLHRSFQGLKRFYEQQEFKQTGQWLEIGNRLNELKEMSTQHEELESHVINQLKKLEAENGKIQAIMKDGLLSDKELNELKEANKEIVTRMKEYGEANEQLSLKIDRNVELQQQMSEQISKQGENQDEVFTRLEKQEALTEKVARQIDHFRSILFERTSYLAEKIESGYQLTSSYVTKLMTGDDQPLMMNQIQREKQKSSK